jgi:hypothetical protein
MKQKMCERHGIRAKESEESQIIFKNYLVEFEEEGGRNSLGGRTFWDEERKGRVRDECVRLGSHKTIREVVRSVLGQEKTLQKIKKRFFIGETQRGA